jgi:thiosulfate reductase cytochrome b subunit
LAAFLHPAQMASGFLYWGYNSWAEWGFAGLSLGLVALVHTAGAFAIFSFIIVHIYMTTTGHTIFFHIKAMITGLEEIEEGVEIEDWEQAGQHT